MEDYVSVDDDVLTCDDLSEESIVDDIIAARSTACNADADDDDDDDKRTDGSSADQPSMESALAACETSRLFLHGQPGLDDVLGNLCNINKSVTSADAGQSRRL